MFLFTYSRNLITRSFSSCQGRPSDNPRAIYTNHDGPVVEPVCLTIGRLGSDRAVAEGSSFSTIKRHPTYVKKEYLVARPV